MDYSNETAVSADTARRLVNPLRYIGAYHEGDGVYKMGARFYDTAQGRFTQTDPSGQESNPYAYASCNPINGKDPSGLITECGAYSAILTIGGGVLVAASLIISAVATGGTTLALVGAAIAALGYALTPSGIVLAFAALADRC